MCVYVCMCVCVCLPLPTRLYTIKTIASYKYILFSILCPSLTLSIYLYLPVSLSLVSVVCISWTINLNVSLNCRIFHFVDFVHENYKMVLLFYVSLLFFFLSWFFVLVSFLKSLLRELRKAIRKIMCVSVCIRTYRDDCWYATDEKGKKLWATLGHGHDCICICVCVCVCVRLWLVLDFCMVVLLPILYGAGAWLAFNIWQQLSKKLERVLPRRRPGPKSCDLAQSPQRDPQVKVGDVPMFVLFVIATLGRLPFF